MTRLVYQRGVRFASTGTKRLSNLLCSTKWSHAILEQFLWRWAGRDLPRLGEQDEMALAIWDESVLEKPGSIPLEGLCPVRSSKEARLKRIMPGYYNPRQDRRCLSPACGPTLDGSTRFAATCCTHTSRPRTTAPTCEARTRTVCWQANSIRSSQLT